MAKDSLNDHIQSPESEKSAHTDEIEVHQISPSGTLAAEPQVEIELISTEEDASKPSGKREIVKSATLVMLGNLGSSVLGMVRQTFVAHTGDIISDTFFNALTPMQRFYDLLVNGSVGGALIPTFNDHAAPDKREELRRLVFTIVNLVILITATASLIFFFIAPWFVGQVLTGGDQQQLTVHYSQIIFLALLIMAPFSVLQAALYSRKEFGWAAFATASFHVGIIIGALLTTLLTGTFIGKYGLAFGVIFGAIGEIALLIPGLHKQRLRYMFVLDLKHPAIRHILRLYVPIAISFVVSSAFAFLDQFLANRTPCASFMIMPDGCGKPNFAAMNFATTLIQFPIGLVAAALGFAVLPTLTSHAREGRNEQFKDTLLLGFRLGLLLMIPAAAGLIVLRTPIVGAIFERGNFLPENTQITAMALQNYAYQLPFVAIDQLLINAFYARKNTIIPVVVLAASVLGYLAVALPLWQTIGMPALPLANTAQNSLHAVILLVLLRMAIGPLHLRKMLPALLKILLATAVMVALAWGLQQGLNQFSFFAHPTFLSRLITIILVGGLAATAYFAVVILLKVEEVALVKGAVLAKLGKK